jgi:hypothetical protein
VMLLPQSEADDSGYGGMHAYGRFPARSARRVHRRGVHGIPDIRTTKRDE